MLFRSVITRDGADPSRRTYILLKDVIDRDAQGDGVLAFLVAPFVLAGDSAYSSGKHLLIVLRRRSLVYFAQEHVIYYVNCFTEFG